MTIKRSFTKPATTYHQQVANLQSRGMQVDDASVAVFYLQHLNYYRLAAYWVPFEADHSTHSFKPGTSFEAVLNLYTFDRELRLLVLDAIERIEVSVRSQWAYQLANLHGSHAHMNGGIHRQQSWARAYADLEVEVDRSKETFIQHFRGVYAEPMPPVWAVCEVMSIGILSRWYSSLQPMPTRRAISDPYGLDETVLESWLHHLTVVRNICAHHARLWNRDFQITPIRPRTKPADVSREFMTGSRKLYNPLLILVHFMDTISPGNHWRQRVKDLVAKHAISVAAMGFPSNWLSRPIWQ